MTRHVLSDGCGFALPLADFSAGGRNRALVAPCAYTLDYNRRRAASISLRGDFLLHGFCRTGQNFHRRGAVLIAAFSGRNSFNFDFFAGQTSRFSSSIPSFRLAAKQNLGLLHAPAWKTDMTP
jgi:hypothetical protein